MGYGNSAKNSYVQYATDISLILLGIGIVRVDESRSADEENGGPANEEEEIFMSICI